jgi:hypothetical protein
MKNKGKMEFARRKFIRDYSEQRENMFRIG